MLNYVIQRIIWIFVILFATLTITFVLLKIAPEYPPTKVDDKDLWLEKQVNLGYYTVERLDATNPDDVAHYEYVMSNNKNIDKTIFGVKPINNNRVLKIFYRVPISTQYFKWLGNVFTKWDWGDSTKIRTNTPAFEILVERMPWTLSLNLYTLLFYMPIGFLFGIIAALKKNTWVDNFMQVTIMIFLSIPGLVFILILMASFGYKWNILPATFPTIGIDPPGRIALGYIIPILALGLPAIAGLTRMLRAELSEVLTSEYVLLAKTKGLSHQQAVVRHAIRNSLVPMVPIVIGSFASLLGGSIIVELVYMFPGVGRITLQAMAVGNYDYNVIMVSSAFYGVIGLFTTLIVDLSYGIIDPQIRMGGKK